MLRRMKTSSKVPIGLATIFGYGAAFVAFASYVVTTLTASQAQIEGPGKTVLIAGTILTGLIGAGRQLQSAGVKLPGHAQSVLDDLPSLMQELRLQPPSLPVSPVLSEALGASQVIAPSAQVSGAQQTPAEGA